MVQRFCLGVGKQLAGAVDFLFVAPAVTRLELADARLDSRLGLAAVPAQFCRGIVHGLGEGLTAAALRLSEGAARQGNDRYKCGQHTYEHCSRTSKRRRTGV